MADLIEGFDSEGYEDWCEDVYNFIKNHARMSDPCTNLSGIQPGMIVSDSDDDKLYHYTGASGEPCEEILQATLSYDLTPLFASVDLGENNITTLSRARAYLVGSQDDIVNGAYRDVQLNAETYDSGNNFNIVTYTFTTPVPGWYHIDAAIQMHDCVVGQTYYGAVEYDGGIVFEKILVAATTWHHFNISDKIYCAAAKTIKLQVKHTDVGDTLDITGGSPYTYMSIHLLSI